MFKRRTLLAGFAAAGIILVPAQINAQQASAPHADKIYSLSIPFIFDGSSPEENLSSAVSFDFVICQKSLGQPSTYFPDKTLSDAIKNADFNKYAIMLLALNPSGFEDTENPIGAKVMVLCKENQELRRRLIEDINRTVEKTDVEYQELKKTEMDCKDAGINAKNKKKVSDLDRSCFKAQSRMHEITDERYEAVSRNDEIYRREVKVNFNKIFPDGLPIYFHVPGYSLGNPTPSPGR